MSATSPKAGTLWQDRRTGIWQWSVQREGCRRTISTRTTSRRAALAKANEWAESFLVRSREDLLESIAGDLRRSRASRPDSPALSRCPIEEAWLRFPALVTARGTERPLAESSREELANQWRQFLAWIPQHDPSLRYLDEIAPRHAAAFRDDLLGRMTGRRATGILCTCRLLCQRAGIVPNPFADLRAASGPPGRRRPFTDEELRRILADPPPSLRLLLLLLLYTGQRLGDCARFAWEQIAPDLSGLSTVPSKTAHLGETIWIPLHPAIREILAAVPIGERSGPLLPKMAEAYRRSRSSVCHLVCSHLRKCEVPTSAIGPLGRPVPVTGAHAFRHTCCTWLAEANVPEAVARQILGHHSELVHRVYVHIRREATTAAIHSLRSL